MANWRLIEDELCDYFRVVGNGIELDISSSSGDKIAFSYDEYSIRYTIANLTELAKLLAARIPSEPVKAQS